MTKRKWTPGPWRVFDGDKVLTVAPHGKLVAETDPDNAHLIAAAPKLYDLLDWAQSTGLLDHGGMGDVIRAALAKARGE